MGFGQRLPDNLRRLALVRPRLAGLIAATPWRSRQIRSPQALDRLDARHRRARGPDAEYAVVPINRRGGAEPYSFTGGFSWAIPADLDGANGWQRFRHVTLPMLSGVTFFVATISLISALQVFTRGYVMFDHVR
jgi:hypothetical protein